MIKIFIKNVFRTILFIALSMAFPLVWVGAWVAKDETTIKEAFQKTKNEYVGFFNHIFKNEAYVEQFDREEK